MSAGGAPAQQLAGKPGERITEFDGLRGVLAWTVVASHILICCGWFGPSPNGTALLNEVVQAAVDIFILLSGFAITRLLIIERESYGRYIWRRVCRIVPAYWGALSAGILLNGWLAANLRRLPASSDAQWMVMICETGQSRLWIDGALHYALLHGLAPVPLLPWAPFTFLGVAWSLSLEWQFYLLAPLALWFVAKWRFGLTSLVSTAAVGLAMTNPWTNWFTVAFIGIKGGFLLAGGLTFVAAQRLGTGRAGLLLVLLPASVAALLWWCGIGRLIEAAVTAIGWSLVLVSVYSQHLNFPGAFLRSAAMQYLGRISYSTYLFHVPVITLVQRAIWTSIQPANQMQLLAWTSFGTIVGTLIVSQLSWQFIERPFLRFGGVGRQRK